MNQPKPSQPAPPAPRHVGVSSRTYEDTIVLSYFFGMLGVDRLYLGKIGTGVAKLLTFGGLGIWYAVDLVLAAHGKLRDEHGLAVQDADKPHTLIRVMALVSAAMIGLYIVSVLGFAALMVAGIAFTESVGRESKQQQSRVGDVAARGMYGENSYILTLSENGCGVVRTVLPDEDERKARGAHLTWELRDGEGFTLLERAADSEDRYRYYTPGEGLTVRLMAFDPELGKYVVASNTLEYRCGEENSLQGADYFIHARVAYS